MLLELKQIIEKGLSERKETEETNKLLTSTKSIVKSTLNLSLETTFY